MFLANAQNQATAALSIAGDQERIIRWHGWSLTENVGQSAIIYGIAWSDGVFVSGNPTACEQSATVPLPYVDPATREVDPLKLTHEVQTKYFIASILLRSGTQTYKIRFYLTGRDRETNDTIVLGYFSGRHH